MPDKLVPKPVNAGDPKAVPAVRISKDVVIPLVQTYIIGIGRASTDQNAMAYIVPEEDDALLNELGATVKSLPYERLYALQEDIDWRRAGLPRDILGKLMQEHTSSHGQPAMKMDIQKLLAAYAKAEILRRKEGRESRVNWANVVATALTSGGAGTAVGYFLGTKG